MRFPIVCNKKMIKTSCSHTISLILVLILLCLAPSVAPAETSSEGALPRAADLVPPADASRAPQPDITKPDDDLSSSRSFRFFKQESSDETAVSGRDDIKLSQKHPLSIAISPDDTKAHLAIEQSFRIFTQSMKPRFSMWLERSGRYVVAMQAILREKNMPAELVFLPIVESGFNPKAYSRARAAGPWQFIAGTAKRYGLAIDWWKDERKDPIKSTIAASRYLSDLYDMFGSWSLALAAYNAGEGRIAKALRKSKSDDFWPLLNTRQIRKETKDYVPRYIAAAMIANTPKEYGFHDLTYHAPFEYDEVVVYVPVDLDIVAECAGTDVDTIRELNPELRRWSTPPNVEDYTVRIPLGKSDIFIEKLAKIPDERIFSYDTYMVKKSDTMKKIAAKSKVPISVILELNSLTGIERLKPGEEIRLPPQGKYFADIDDRMTARKNKKRLAKHSKKSDLKHNTKVKAKPKAKAKTASHKTSSRERAASS
jgi:membrane-bound lytic murein transglycosylase D